MTSDQLRTARKALGLTQHGMAEALRMGKHGWQTISAWENGKQPIPGPVQIAVNCLLSHGGTKDERENFSGKGKTAPEKSKDSTTW